MITTINKYLPLLGWGSVISGVVAAIYFAGGFMEKTEKGILTPEEKVRLLDHEAAAPNDVDSYIMFKSVDSIFKVEKKDTDDAIRSRAKRDSMIRVTQSIGLKNADQIYQTRQDIDTILKILKKK